MRIVVQVKQFYNQQPVLPTEPPKELKKMAKDLRPRQGLITLKTKDGKLITDESGKMWGLDWQGDLFLLDTKQRYAFNQAGKVVQRVLVDKPSETTVMLPDTQITSTYKNFKTDTPAFKRLDKKFTPTKLVSYPHTFEGVAAWHLFEKTMVKEAPPKAWGKVEVHKNKKAKKVFNDIIKEIL